MTDMNQRRTRTRRRILKGAKVHPDCGTAIACLIRSISTEAACLEFPGPVSIPGTIFHLELDSDQSVRRCRLAWQTRRHVGVTFEH
jgi:hypothetical protein